MSRNIYDEIAEDIHDNCQSQSDIVQTLKDYIGPYLEAGVTLAECPIFDCDEPECELCNARSLLLAAKDRLK